MNNKENTTNKKILWVLLIFLLALLLVYIIYILQNKFSKCECDNEYSNIETSKFKNTFKVEEVETNVKDDSDDKVYTKIKLSITNESSKPSYMNSYMFTIVDDAEELISTCDTGATIGNNVKDDILPEMAPENSEIEGYIYCNTDVANIEMLEIFYVTDFRFESGGLGMPEFQVLKFNLKEI